MKRSLLLCGLLALSAAPAHAAQVMMCAPEQSSGAQARQIGGANSQVPSQTLYSVNGIGCALILQADVGYFQSMGYVQGSSQASVLGTVSGLASGTTAVQIGTLPAKAYIQQIIFSNTSANAVTGGISMGISGAAPAGIVAATPLAATTDIIIPSASILLPIPVSTGVGSPLFVAAATSWNNAVVNITVIYGYY